MRLASPQTIVNPPTSPRVGIGALLLVAAFLLIAVMSALGKVAAGLPTTTLVFFQNAISLVLFLPWALHGGIQGIKTEHLLLHGVRGVGGMLSQALMFLALGKMPLMNAVLLSNSAPLFIPLVAWLWLKERISTTTWLSVGIGFVGVVLILRPNRELLTNPSALYAITAAACSAVALVTVNRLSSTEPTSRILFYYFLSASLLTAPLLPLGWKSPTGPQWACLAGIGLCMAVSQLLIILAYHYAKPSAIAPFNYSVVIFSGLIGWIFWHNVPGWLSLIGVAGVTLGGVLSTASAGPNSRGHLGWIGHWNLPFLHRRNAATT
jgi:drug/metabolite transporter (DMT)-like permease